MIIYSKIRGFGKSKKEEEEYWEAKKKEQEEIRQQVEERDRKAIEHKEALAWCTKRCNEYKQEKNRKLIEVLNII